MPSICVAYLVWAPYGPDLLSQFIDSYRDHPAGVPHDLVLLMNGFADLTDTEIQEAMSEYRSITRELAHREFRLSSNCLDLAAYLALVRHTRYEYYCFFNSYVRLLHNDWLAKLYENAARPTVGIVGTTGSYESFAYSHWIETPNSGRITATTPAARAMFHDYPNAHVRTNGFMMSRNNLMEFCRLSVESKLNAFELESGLAGLTARTIARGLEALIVDKEGRGWSVPDWPRSRTFRSGRQENLLISDNHTEAYNKANAKDKAGLRWASWQLTAPSEDSSGEVTDTSSLEPQSEQHPVSEETGSISR
ncbi:MAG: hypothetical protein ACYCOU_16025 [Sulfobacillus sp.]